MTTGHATPTPGQRLRQAAARETLQIPGAFNALTARLIERMGFPAMYLSGAAFSAGALGIPDIGLFTLSELVTQTTWLTRQTRLPVIVDADTGFGEAVNVERTVIELQAAGAAAIQFEDQRLPTRCGHLSGTSLVEPAEMVAKIHAAVAARNDQGLVILARTDARASDGLEAAIDRALQYIDAGADWIFPEALTSPAEFETFAQRVRVPLVANMTEFGKSPLMGYADLKQLGYAGVLYPVTLLRLAMKAVERGLATLLADGNQQSLLDQMQTRQELYDLLGYTGYEERDRSYFRGESAS